MASDPFVKVVIEGFQILAKLLQSVPEMTIRAIFPWCFTPDLYAALERITAPTQITFGRTDQVTSTRFADQMMRKIRNSELLVFEGCAHYEKVEEFNQRTVQFLRNHTGGAAPLAGHA